MGWLFGDLPGICILDCHPINSIIQKQLRGGGVKVSITSKVLFQAFTQIKEVALDHHKSIYARAND